MPGLVGEPAGHVRMREPDERIDLLSVHVPGRRSPSPDSPAAVAASALWFSVTVPPAPVQESLARDPDLSRHIRVMDCRLAATIVDSLRRSLTLRQLVDRIATPTRGSGLAQISKLIPRIHNVTA